MQRLARTILGVAVFFAPPTAAVAQLPSFGPLTAEEGAPLQRLGLTPMVEGADLTPRGVVRSDVWLGYSNIFEQDSAATSTLYLDLERLVTALTVRYGVHERLELGARATLETTWGGFLDGYVLVYHWSFHLGNRGRARFPERAYSQTLEDADGRVLVDVPSRRMTFEDVRVFAKWRAIASDDGRRLLSVKTILRIPTAENTIGDERSDLGVFLLGRAAEGRWNVHAMAGATTVRRSPTLMGVLRDGPQWFGMLGLERRVRERLSAVLEFTGSSQLLRDFGDHDVSGAPTNAILGVVGVTEGGWRWEFGMQEDFPPRGPSLDFTFQFALARSF